MRPATYESASEAEVLKTFFRGRTPELENTTFTLCDPEGEPLTRGGRSPSFLFDDASEMAESLEEYAFVYEPSKHFRERSLPKVKDLRLALNVAACDSLPLVIGVAKKDRDRRALEERLATFAWSKGVPGRAHYVLVETTAGLEAFEDFRKGSEVYVVQPEAYGRNAKVLGRAHRKDKTFDDKLRAALDANAPVDKGDGRQHVGRGRREGIDWESELPVTDPGRR